MFNEITANELRELINKKESFAIYNARQIVDWIEVGSDEEINRYKDIAEFAKWFRSYIQIYNAVEQKGE